MTAPETKTRARKEVKKENAVAEQGPFTLSCKRQQDDNKSLIYIYIHKFEGEEEGLAEASRVEEGPAVARHRERLPRRRVEELLKGLKPPREILVLAHDGLVPPLEDVDVLRCLCHDGSL